MKPDIKNHNDIIIFINGFYNKVKQDELLGPIFNGVVADWAAHLEKMYKFWNAALFEVPGFKGNPFAKHAPLPIAAEHFNRRLFLSNEIIDNSLEGEMATDTKKRAELMAAMFLSRL